MLVRFGLPIVEINGKVGNNIFRCGVTGKFMTPYVHTEHTPTPKQINVRILFGRAARFAGHAPGIELHRDCWWIWSYNHPIKNKKAEDTYMTPFLAATTYNIYRQQDNLPMRICPYHLF